MTVETFKPAIWAARLLEKYQGALVFAQGSVANRDYQGEITRKGDRVVINSIGDPTIKDYTGGELDLDDLSTEDQELIIDQAKYFAFKVDSVDAVQAAGDIKAPALARASYKLAAQADKFAAQVVARSALAANHIGRVKIVSGGTQIAGAGQITAYDLLVELGIKLDQQDVPAEGRYAVIDPLVLGAIRKDDRFLRVDASGSTETLRNGIVYRAAGFDILLSNNLATFGGTGAAKDDKVIVAGTPAAFSFAEQILDIKAGDLGTQGFGDYVKGLNVYGAKVTLPEGIATASVQAIEPGTGATTVVTAP